MAVLIIIIIFTLQETPSDDVMDYAISWLVYNEAIKSVPGKWNILCHSIFVLQIMCHFEYLFYQSWFNLKRHTRENRKYTTSNISFFSFYFSSSYQSVS